MLCSIFITPFTYHRYGLLCLFTVFHKNRRFIKHIQSALFIHIVKGANSFFSFGKSIHDTHNTFALKKIKKRRYGILFCTCRRMPIYCFIDTCIAVGTALQHPAGRLAVLIFDYLCLPGRTCYMYSPIFIF